MVTVSVFNGFPLELFVLGGSAIGGRRTLQGNVGVSPDIGDYGARMVMINVMRA